MIPLYSGWMLTYTPRHAEPEQVRLSTKAIRGSTDSFSNRQLNSFRSSSSHHRRTSVFRTGPIKLPSLIVKATTIRPQACTRTVPHRWHPKVNSNPSSLSKVAPHPFRPPTIVITTTINPLYHPKITIRHNLPKHSLHRKDPLRPHTANPLHHHRTTASALLPKSTMAALHPSPALLEPPPHLMAAVARLTPHCFPSLKPSTSKAPVT